MTIPGVGLYARFAGDEYRLIQKKGWALWSRVPRDGFTERSKRDHIRHIEPGEALECFRLDHAGTYRGCAVSVEPSRTGFVLAYTFDRGAADAGFEPYERGEWRVELAQDDAELRFTTTRTPVPCPWAPAD